MRPIDPKATFRLVHPSEQKLPESEQTTGIGRCLTFRERTHVESMGTRMIGAADRAEDMRFDIRAGEVKRWRLKFGLVGMENFPGFETEAGPWAGSVVVTDAFLDTVPDEWLTWFAGEIKRRTDVSVADAGKS